VHGLAECVLCPFPAVRSLHQIGHEKLPSADVVRIFGRVSGAGARGCTEAGLRKASTAETAEGICAGDAVGSQTGSYLSSRLMNVAAGVESERQCNIHQPPMAGNDLLRSLRRLLSWRCDCLLSDVSMRAFQQLGADLIAC